MARERSLTAPQQGHDAETEVEKRESLKEHAEEIREDAEQRFAESGDLDDDRDLEED